MKKLMLSCVITAGLLYGGQCSSDDYDRAEYFAEKAMSQIIDKFGGGRDERMDINKCRYNTYSKSFKLDVSIYWNGLINVGNKYNIDGTLKFDRNGNSPEFARSYANQNVKDLDFWRYVVGGIIVLNALAEKNKDR